MSEKSLEEKFCEKFINADFLDEIIKKHGFSEFISQGRDEHFREFCRGYTIAQKEKEQGFEIIRKNLEEVIGKMRTDLLFREVKNE